MMRSMRMIQVMMMWMMMRIRMRMIVMVDLERGRNDKCDAIKRIGREPTRPIVKSYSFILCIAFIAVTMCRSYAGTVKRRVLPISTIRNSLLRSLQSKEGKLELRWKIGGSFFSTNSRQAQSTRCGSEKKVTTWRGEILISEFIEEQRFASYFSSQTQTLLVETLALPSEMVAESVVNNIQTGGGRDNSAGDDELILQLVIALSVGEYTASWNRISNNY